MTAAFLEQESTTVGADVDRGLDWLRAAVIGTTNGVDREAGIIRGVILAESGAFKTPGRGEFDNAAIKQVVKLAKAKSGGLKSRFGHPTLSDDGLGKLLGRVKDVRTDTIQRPVKTDDGKTEMRDVLIARGDLHLDKTALDTPPNGNKPLGIYIMDLAESDPDAFGTSLVLKADQAWRLDKHKQPERDKNGVELPPLWMPTELHASDVVDEGDATNSALSIDSLPDAALRRGVELLDQQFSGKGRSFVEARLRGFMERYLTLRYGEADETTVTSTHGTESITMPPPVDTEPEVTVTDDALLLDIDLTLEDE